MSLQSNRNRIVVVLGMHRSGTSAMTRALEVLGIDLGNTLIPGIAENNEKGFYEDIEINRLNSDILASMGKRWDSLHLMEAADLQRDAVAPLRERAVALLRSRLGERPFGMKDPRIARLLPFWQAIFQELGLDPCYVIVVRHPLSIAHSLEKRDKFDPAKTYYLWLSHILPALSGTTGATRIVVDFDRMMAQPALELKRVALALDFPFSENSAAFMEFADEFLDEGLRHTCFGPEDLRHDPAANSDVIAAYELLSRLARDEVPVDGPEVQGMLVAIQERLRWFVPGFEYLDRLDEVVDKLVQSVSERENEIKRLQQNVSDRERELAGLTTTVFERDTQITLLNQGLNDAKRQLEQVLASLSWRLTRPMRVLWRLTKGQIAPALRHMVMNGGRRLWRAVPLPFESKRRLKGFAVRTFAWVGEKVFRREGSHGHWWNRTLSAIPGEARGVAAGGAEDEYVPLLRAAPVVASPVRLICFYLPQFHAIPENDAWWGEGFTEWTNVEPARPQFIGHHQPRIPGELGYYDLLDPAVQRRQVELARLYGIGGFCFYFYWFGGRRLLEAPIEQYLNDASLDLPFCLCWANENWSRRWDGLDSEILIAQEHSAADDLAFIRHVARHMRDERYIRIDGKPLLLVYRPSLLPAASETASRWRDWCRSNGLGEIYLAYTQSFEVVDPAVYGFDAAIEFPPNNSAPPDITDSVIPVAEDFRSTVYDWRVFVERSECYAQPAYTLFRSVCPSWDNTARRKNRGTVFLHSTPALYQRWLENAVHDTLRNRARADERLVFVNAWNEWAEGACLEPDSRYGYAYLQATKNALGGLASVPDRGRKVVLVTHDAYPHGAQFLALNLAKTLSHDMGFHVDLVCLGEGPLKAEYAKWATLHDLTGVNARGMEAKALAKRLYDAGHRAALVNTTVSGHFLETLSNEGFRCVALIHELGGVLNQNRLHGHARAISRSAHKIVFPAREVASAFGDVAPVAEGSLVIRPQGLYKRRKTTQDHSTERAALREKLRLPADSQIVLGVGHADHRKGVDLFVEAGLALGESHPNAFWVWVGHWEHGMHRAIARTLASHSELEGRFIFPGLQADTDIFYGGADVFALTSREDPFPSVILEAMEAGLPVVGFDGAGGFVDLLSEGCGQLVEHGNAVAFGAAVGALLDQPERRLAAGLRGKQLIDERFSFRHYVFDLLDLLGVGLDRISVVVPNYNYEHHLPERLASILKQDYPLFEVLFLDDASDDDSVKVAEDILSNQPIDYRVIANAENSGSVFRQWKKGVDCARGSHVWIAEADDSCSENFLGEVRKGFRTPGVILSYCESRQIDERGETLAGNYLDYVSDIDARHWLTPFAMDGNKEAAQSFSIKNVIPNVSAVLFDARELRAVLDEHIERIVSFRVAGDWLVYVLTLKRGRIAFSPVSANAHRRHSGSVTLGSFNAAQLKEIREMQDFVAKEFAVSTAQTEMARAYATRLAGQFGLPVAT